MSIRLIIFTARKIWKKAVSVIAIPLIVLLAHVSLLIAQPVINNVTFSPNPVAAYEKFELTIDITASYTNPFNPDDIDLWAVFTSPSSESWNVKGFWDGTDWKIRFATNETGTWSFIVYLNDQSGQSNSSSENFTCTSSSHPGWLRVSSSDTHFLCYDDGSSFYGIGQCRCWNLEQVPSIFNDMQSHGMNLLAYWMPHWDNMLVTMTTGYDQYDMAHASNIDNVVEDCEDHNIYLMLTIWNHDELRGDGHSWGNTYFEAYNPFSSLSTATGFMSNTTSWIYQQRLYRYIIARWGYSRAIGQWLTVCEIDGTTNLYNNDVATDPWHNNINNYFKNNDPFSHPTTSSKAGDRWWPIGYSVMDIPQIHSYDKANDAIAIADRLAYWTRRMWSDYDKPNVIGEFGTSSEVLQPMHLHNGLWASFSSGAAITALDWNDGNTFGDFNAEMYNHCSYLADFISGIQFDQLGLSPTPLSTDVELKAWGMNGDTSGYLWIQDTSPGESNSGKSITISGVTDGMWELNWYNTWTGNYYGAAVTENASGNSITTTIPDFSNDIACRMASGSGDNTVPVELSSFTAKPGDAKVKLNWVTESELNNVGFILERALQQDGDFQEIASYKYTDELMGQGNSSIKTEYFYTDKNLINSTVYKYRLSDVHMNGKINYLKTINVIPDLVISKFKLHANFPNPFNPGTTIKFNVPDIDGRNNYVSITIYDALGRQVRNLFEKRIKGGIYQIYWDGRNDFGKVLSSGIYFYELNSDQSRQLKKMLLVR